MISELCQIPSEPWVLWLLSTLTCPTGSGTEQAAYLGTAYHTAAEAEPAAAEQGNQAVGTADTSDLWIKNVFS